MTEPVVYISVDVEASGPVPGLYNLVSIGAVPVVFGDGAWRATDDKFYVELKPIAAGFDPGAMAVHGLSREHLEKNGLPAEVAMRRLSDFVARCLGPAPARDRAGSQAASPARVTFVGHNAAFDWAYVSYYYERFYLPNPFGYKALDSKSLAMGRLGIGWFDTSKETLENLLKLPAQDAGLIHRADYDALYQAWILAALLNLPAPAR